MAPKNSDRELLERMGPVRLFVVSRGHRVDHYEVVCGSQQWSFSLLWSALSKFDRVRRSKSTQP